MEAVLFCSGAPGCCQSHHRVAVATGAPQGCPRDTPTTPAGQGDVMAEVPPCSDCWSHSKETTDHVLLKCPTFVVHQANLASRYRDLGLPSDTASALLFLTGPNASKALWSLLTFLEDTGLDGYC
ncbi:uncharacterized protein LOC144103901 [Amblyomma americanum]